jgi:hypothetical protein
MPQTFILQEEKGFRIHPDAWLRGGAAFASGQVTGYRVGGLPDGRSARIANFGAPNKHDWRIMKIEFDNSQTGWTGHYQTMEDALTALVQRAKEDAL